MPKSMKNSNEYSGASSIPQSLIDKIGLDVPLSTVAQDIPGAINELNDNKLGDEWELVATTTGTTNTIIKNFRNETYNNPIIYREFYIVVAGGSSNYTNCFVFNVPGILGIDQATGLPISQILRLQKAADSDSHCIINVSYNQSGLEDSIYIKLYAHYNRGSSDINTAEYKVFGRRENNCLI